MQNKRAFNSTIKLKQKICVRCGKPCYWFSKKRCKDCARIEDAMNDDGGEVEETESFQYLVSDLDEVFSKYVRLYHCDEKGFIECYTSGNKMRWQEAQCGHYISRKHLATRWLLENCRPQSEYDNCYLHGNIEVFARKLDEEKAGTTDYLLELSREVTKPSLDELKQLIISYRWKVKLLEKKIKH